MPFKDYFSGHAANYATYRPRYPAALFEWLVTQCPERDRAWDCATGNGQAAISLTQYFREVVATDGSAAQLSQAPEHPQISYRVALAEDSGLPDGSADLITVAQAVHWFTLEAFYQEVRRVLKPRGILALWCYGRPVIASLALNQQLMHYYEHVLKDFWTSERHLVETGYRDLPFPFVEMEAPGYTMQVQWTLAQLMGYLFTWSATQRFIAAWGHNPLDELALQMAASWSDPQAAVSWPIRLRVGRVP